MKQLVDGAKDDTWKALLNAMLAKPATMACFRYHWERSLVVRTVCKQYQSQLVEAMNANIDSLNTKKETDGWTFANNLISQWCDIPDAFIEKNMEFEDCVLAARESMQNNAQVLRGCVLIMESNSTLDQAARAAMTAVGVAMTKAGTPIVVPL